MSVRALVVEDGFIARFFYGQKLHLKTADRTLDRDCRHSGRSIRGTRYAKDWGAINLDDDIIAANVFLDHAGKARLCYLDQTIVFDEIDAC